MIQNDLLLFKASLFILGVECFPPGEGGCIAKGKHSMMTMMMKMMMMIIIISLCLVNHGTYIQPNKSKIKLWQQ